MSRVGGTIEPSMKPELGVNNRQTGDIFRSRELSATSRNATARSGRPNLTASSDRPCCICR